MPVALLLALGLVGCSNDSRQPVEPKSETEGVALDCPDFPEVLPAGITIEDVKGSLDKKAIVPFQMLIPEVLEELGSSFRPEEYYIDTSGLHWGHPKNIAEKVSGDCYHPYGLSIVGGFHFVYWFSYRPPSYNAYMAWIPIYAQPYGSNGILVQKRDICWICNCNPWCALLWTWICAK